MKKENEQLNQTILKLQKELEEQNKLEASQIFCFESSGQLLVSKNGFSPLFLGF